MKCVEVYKELYHQEPFDVAFCPYRISPLGAHIDHQYGKINGLAIDKGIHMAYHPKQNGVVELQSLNFPKRAQFFVSAVPDEKQGDWADHLRGAAKMLGEKYRLKRKRQPRRKVAGHEAADVRRRCHPHRHPADPAALWSVRLINKR